MLRLLIIISVFLISSAASAQYVFVDFNQSDFKFQIRYSDSIGYQLKGVYPQLDSLSKEFVTAYEERFSGEKSWLVYTHSLFGAVPVYSDIANYVVGNKILDSSEHVLVRVQWGSWNPLYDENQEIAVERGGYLAQFLKVFMANDYKVNMLLHSMGSKLLQGALPKLDTGDQLRHVIFVAPDLSADYFKRDSHLIVSHIKHAHCFHTRNDIVLWMSEQINDQPRLGNTDSIQIDLPHISFYNTRKMNCLLKNNHANWLTCPEIQGIIRKILMDEP